MDFDIDITGQKLYNVFYKNNQEVICVDDLENKDVFDGNDEELKKNDLPETADKEVEEVVPEEGKSENNEPLDEKEAIESQFSDLVSQIKAKNEDKILKDDVQDWDGLVDDSHQDAEAFVLNESSDISDEKIESIEVMEIDEDDERLCSICHRRLKMEKDGITYEYCKRCRNELLETGYNWKSVVTFVLSCVVFVFAVALSAVAIINSLGTAKAASYAKNARLESASNAYSTLINASSESTSSYAPFTIKDLFTVKTGDNVLKAYARTLFDKGDFSTLKTVIETYFPEAELEKPQNADIKVLSDRMNGLFDVGQSASTIVGPLQNSESVTKEDADKAIAELEKLKEDPSLDSTFLTYYQYYVATMLDDAYDLQLEYLEMLEKEAPDLKLFYLSGFANTYLYLEEYDKCVEYCDLALKDNVEDFGSWRMKIKVLYRQKKYDEALALSNEALGIAKSIYSSDDSSAAPDITYAYSIYMEQAVIYEIKGDMKKAQDAIDKAYQGQLTLDTIYLYAMINGKNGNTEAYDEVISMLAQYQMTLPAVCEEYIKGEKTLEEIIVDGKVAWY